MVDIRSATYTSSYSTGTLTIATPADMEPGDLLIMFLVAHGVHWGFYEGGVTFGNPPDGRAAAVVTYPPGGPSLAQHPHTPPFSTLAGGMGPMEFAWNDSVGGQGYCSNYWSNLGVHSVSAGYDTPGNATVRQRWPFISSWIASPPTAPTPITPTKPNMMSSLTAVGRPVDGTELSSYSFTLNNPLDSEYDYRGFALCFEPNDWSGNFLDYLPYGGTGAMSLKTSQVFWWVATGSRSKRENVGTRYDGLGGYFAYNGSDGHLLPSDLAYWPPDPDDDYVFIADLSTGQQTLEVPPLDLNTSDDLLLHILTYAGPTSYGDPSSITVADLSATTPVDPLTVLHEETWAKGSSTLMVQVCQTHVTPDHAVDSADDPPGTGLVHLTARVFEADDGPITAPYPTTEWPAEIMLGLALTFRVRVPYPVTPAVAIPARLATIIG